MPKVTVELDLNIEEFFEDKEKYEEDLYHEVLRIVAGRIVHPFLRDTGLPAAEKLITAAAERVTDEKVSSIVDGVLASPLQRTDNWGGKLGEPVLLQALVADADVVVHLAFIIMGSREESAHINLEGTRNVFEATVRAARPKRLVYTS